MYVLVLLELMVDVGQASEVVITLYLEVVAGCLHILLRPMADRLQVAVLERTDLWLMYQRHIEKIFGLLDLLESSFAIIDGVFESCINDLDVLTMSMDSLYMLKRIAFESLELSTQCFMYLVVGFADGAIASLQFVVDVSATIFIVKSR